MQRILESEQEIADDAEGASFLSEIETIFDQIGGRLAHLNAMLSNLPPMTATAPADATASEIIYADLASAYPSGLDLETTTGTTMLALPAPANANVDNRSQFQLLADDFANIVAQVQAGDLASAGRLVSELFDVKPSQARRGAQALARQIAGSPDLARRIAEVAGAIDETHEYSAATLLSECFEFQAIEALAMVRALKLRLAESDAAQ